MRTTSGRASLGIPGLQLDCSGVLVNVNGHEYRNRVGVHHRR